MSEADWARLVKGWFPQLADKRLRQITWPEIAPHHDFIKEVLPHLTRSTIHQRPRDEHQLDCSASSLRRYVRANTPEEVRRDQVVVLREPVAPGQEAQIDYGSMGMWTDPKTGGKSRVWAFVMVLAASRHMFVRPVLKMDQEAWCTAHVEAFALFGGVPHRLIPDNLRTGVERPDLYDPQTNRAYAELAARYGVLVDPARSRKPRDKGRVERPVPCIRDSYWRGRDFASLEQTQKAALKWCTEVAGQRSCRPLEGAAPAAVFAATEQEALAPLPRRPFVPARWSRATVGPDIHIKCGRALYSVPWRFIGAKVDVRSTATTVQIFRDGELIKTHAATERGKRTDAGDYPPEQIAFQMRTPIWCRRQARRIGEATTAVIGELLAVNALFRLRAAQGVLGLEGKYGPERLEAACAKAVAVGDPSYRTVKGILAAGTGAADVARPAGDGGAPAFLHGPDALFANVIPLSNDEQRAAMDTATAPTHHAPHEDHDHAGPRPRQREGQAS